MTLDEDSIPESVNADTPRSKNPAIRIVLIVIAAIGFVVVAVCGALAGTFGAWIADSADEWWGAELGGAVTGCLAGTVGAPYGLFFTVAFMRRQADPYAWRRSGAHQKFDGFLSVALIVIILASPLILFIAWVIIALPSTFFGWAAVRMFGSVPQPLIGIGVTFLSSALFGFAFDQVFIKPPDPSY